MTDSTGLSMGMIIDDGDVCPKCGSYRATNMDSLTGYCSGMPGHVMTEEKHSYQELTRKGILKTIDLLENGV